MSNSKPATKSNLSNTRSSARSREVDPGTVGITNPAGTAWIGMLATSIDGASRVEHFVVADSNPLLWPEVASFGHKRVKLTQDVFGIEHDEVSSTFFDYAKAVLATNDIRYYSVLLTESGSSPGASLVNHYWEDAGQSTRATLETDCDVTDPDSMPIHMKIEYDGNFFDEALPIGDSLKIVTGTTTLSSPVVLDLYGTILRLM